VEPVGLRPLGVGERLDAAIKIVRRSYPTLLATAAVLVVPIGLLNYLVVISAVPHRNDTADSASAAIAGALLATSFIALAAQVLASALCSKPAGETYLGSRPRPWETLKSLRRRSFSLLRLLVLFVGGFVLGSVLCFLPGVWLFVAWICAFPALFFEGSLGVEALRRSFRLVRGHWWKTFATIFVTYLLAQALAQLLALLVRELVGTVTYANVTRYALLSTASSTLVHLVMTPVYGAVIAVIYLDLRVRKEGLDLMLAAQHVGTAPSEPIAALTTRLTTMSRPALGDADPPLSQKWYDLPVATDYEEPPKGWASSINELSRDDDA
jgi:hypothetical protein